jgi:predicted Rossmann fold nucleotide-binding protein DprA/Smf involved in DNA uptake
VTKKKFYELFKRHAPPILIFVDELFRQCQLTLENFLTILLELELAGRLKPTPYRFSFFTQ